MSDHLHPQSVSSEAGPQPFSPEQVEAHVSGVPAWGVDNDASSISRTFQFRDFTQSMSFANAVAKVAEQFNHHPDILVSYDTVTLVLTTHSLGGLTEKDFLLAQKIDQLPEAAGEVEKEEPFLAG